MTQERNSNAPLITEVSDHFQRLNVLYGVAISKKKKRPATGVKRQQGIPVVNIKKITNKGRPE